LKALFQPKWLAGLRGIPEPMHPIVEGLEWLE
jgi:hypothetical protein